MVINSVQEYIELIEKLKINYTYSYPLYRDGEPSDEMQTYIPQFIFRGHGNHEEYKLLPGVYREIIRNDSSLPTDYSLMEYNILSDFISESCCYLPNVPKKDITSWLEIAQHFGVPTRLLDFTKNPLVALYFACTNKKETDASVWIINEPIYNMSFLGENPLAHAINSQEYVSKIVEEELIHFDGFKKEINWDIRLPRIYKPFYYEERMRSQASVFMIWGADHRAFTEFMEPEHYMCELEPADNARSGVICSVLIPAKRKDEIMEQLDLCGINEKFIFPGIDGIGKYISRKYKNIPF